MSPQELITLCAEAVNNGRETISLVMPDERTHLDGDNSPEGELLCVNSKGEYVVAFEAIDVLAFCVARGFCEVRTIPVEGSKG